MRVDITYVQMGVQKWLYNVCIAVALFQPDVGLKVQDEVGLKSSSQGRPEKAQAEVRLKKLRPNSG